VVHCQSLTNDTNINISLSCFKEQVGISEPNRVTPLLIPVTVANFLDPIILKLTITNKSAKEISVLYPDFIGRNVILSFRDKVTGEQVPDQISWLAGRSSDFITIQQGRNFEALLYLEQLYPNGIPTGAYEIKIKYTPDYKTSIQTDSIYLTIAPQSENEKQYFANYIKFIQEDTENLELFLQKNPVGQFREPLYQLIAQKQIRLKKYEDAISILDAVLSDKNATTYQKGQSLYIKARVLKDYMGNSKDAIQCLEKSPLRSGQVEAKKWKNLKETVRN
jgi:tetratricopeptide (TPR) repeat protein